MTGRTSFTDIYDASERYNRQQSQKLVATSLVFGAIAGFVLGALLCRIT